MPSSEGISIGYQRGVDVSDESVFKQLLDDIAKDMAGFSLTPVQSTGFSEYVGGYYDPWVPTAADMENWSLQQFEVNQINSSWTADWPSTEGVTFVKEPTMTYTVLIRWDGNPVFEVPITVDANSREEAAMKRINLLSDSSRYDDVLVLDASTGSMQTAEMFSVNDFVDQPEQKDLLMIEDEACFLPLSLDNDEPRSGADKPQPKFGWYGDAS